MFVTAVEGSLRGDEIFDSSLPRLRRLRIFLGAFEEAVDHARTLLVRGLRLLRLVPLASVRGGRVFRVAHGILRLLDCRNTPTDRFVPRSAPLRPHQGLSQSF